MGDVAPKYAGLSVISSMAIITECDREIARRVKLLEDERTMFIDIEVGRWEGMKIYGGCAGGGKSFLHANITEITPSCITVTPIINREQGLIIKKLTAEWNRAKVRKNKNLMRDIEKRIKCIQES